VTWPWPWSPLWLSGWCAGAHLGHKTEIEPGIDFSGAIFGGVKNVIAVLEEPSGGAFVLLFDTHKNLSLSLPKFSNDQLM
jgi:hypothetical protein